jgi:hypothetical protein
MRITTKAVYNIETGQLISWIGYEYFGPVDLACSSGGEVGQTDEALQSAQAQVANTLSQDYATTFANQSNVLASQNAKLNYISQNPQGYSPAQLHNATTSINEQTSQAAKQAIGAASAYAAQHGGADVGSGVAGELAGQIASGAAQSKAQQLSSLSQQNQAMKQNNMWSALSGLNQVGAEYGGAAGTAISGGNAAANSATNAGSGALAAQQAGWQDLAGTLGAVGGLVGAGTSFVQANPGGIFGK